MSQPARPAATVAVLRDGTDGIEVFLVKRNAKTSFFPHAHVFPGGRVDPADAAVSMVGGAVDRERMGCTDAAAYQAAAIRETYEEAGLLLAEGAPDPASRKSLHAGIETLAEVAQRKGWVLNAERLVYWSWWITPEIEPRRYSARFFVAVVPSDMAARHDEVETVDSEWLRPADALAKFDRGQIYLAPPTHRTLVELTDFASTEAVLSAGRSRRTPAIMPQLEGSHQGRLDVVLPGHPDHPSPEQVEPPFSFTLDYTRFRSS